MADDDRIDRIDRDLRLLATVRAALRADGGKPTTGPVDELLDARNRLAAD
jgi:hypothetical protein